MNRTEAGNGSGNKPLVYLKNGKQKRQLPTKGYWRDKKTYDYTGLRRLIIPI
ncbi:hypothetical protein [Monoglobus pectinilyticus]|uniref:hypothetical protein n=1 Tax=Monoglobus pectinilyticus TaxID=1981510 RepID=UPI00399ABDE4